MQRLINFFLKYPFVPLFILIIIIIFSIFNIRALNIDTSERSMLIQDDVDLKYYDNTLEKFVSDKLSLVYIEDDNLFSYKKLKQVESLLGDLQSLDGILKTESLFNITNFKNVDDFLSTDPFINEVPEDQNEINQIKRDALHNHLVHSNFISKDGKKIVIKLFLKDYDLNNSEDKAQADLKSDKQLFEINVVNAIDETINKYTNDFDDIFQTGNPFFKKVAYDIIQKDGRIIFPLSLLILLIMIMITINSPHGAFLPLLTSIISVVASIGFMSIMKIPLNMITFIIPSLIIVIGSTEDIHILSEYFEGLEIKKEKNLAIVYLGKKIGTAIVITSLTTFLGFLSISINRVLVLRQFGLAAAFGMFINPVVTILLSPIYLKYFGPKSSGRKNTLIATINNIFTKISMKISRLILNNYKIVIIIFILITAISIGFIMRVKLQYDMLDSFKNKASVKKNIKKYQSDFSGINTYFIRIKENNNQSLLKPEYLVKIDEIKKELESLEEIDMVITISDYIKLVNKGMNFDLEEEFRIPDNEALIYQYVSVLLDPVESQKYITGSFDEANIVIMHSVTPIKELNQLVDKIEEITGKHTKSFGRFKVTGFQVLAVKLAGTLALGTITGILLLSFIIFIIMSILFLNVKAGLISLISNVSPVIFCFGLMGIFNIPFNIGPSMVGMIILGLAVDDTIHLMAKYKSYMRECQNNKKAISETIRSELRPAFSTSISLASLFFVLSLSSLVHIKNFGLLSGMVIIYAFFCDIFFTTILLSKTQLITLFDFLTLRIKKHILGSKLLEGLQLRQVKELLLLGAIREAGKNEIIIKQGDIGNTLNIILEGHVEVSIYDENTKRSAVVANFSEGDVIGEIAVVAPIKRTANIIALTKVTYFEIDGRGLKRIEKMKSKIAAKVYHNISSILGDRIVKLHEKYFEDII